MKCRFCDTPGKHMENKICLNCSLKGLTKADFRLKKHTLHIPTIEQAGRQFQQLVRASGIFNVRLTKFKLKQRIKGQLLEGVVYRLTYYVRN